MSTADQAQNSSRRFNGALMPRIWNARAWMVVIGVMALFAVLMMVGCLPPAIDPSTAKIGDFIRGVHVKDVQTGKCIHIRGSYDATVYQVETCQ